MSEQKFLSIRRNSTDYLVLKEPVEEYVYPKASDDELIKISEDKSRINFELDNLSKTNRPCYKFDEQGHKYEVLDQFASPYYYAPDDICEKPFIDLPEESLREILDGNSFIYPLGGSTKGYYLRDFLRKESVGSFYDQGYYESVNPFCRKSTPLGFNIYNESSFEKGFTYRLGSNWLGSYSVVSTEDSPRNGNLIDIKRVNANNFPTSNENKRYESITLGNDLMKSILSDSYDRIHIEGAMGGGEGNPNRKGTLFTRTFGVSSGYWCFSCYIKATLPEGYPYRVVKVDIPEEYHLFSSEKSSVMSDGFKITNVYSKIIVQVYISNSSTWTLNLVLGGEADYAPTSDVDICGMCFSKGRSPAEIDYREFPVFSPISLYPSNAIRKDKSWTIKYRRLLLGGAPTGEYYDWVDGCPITYPKFEDPDGEELITLTHEKDSSTINYVSFCERTGETRTSVVNYVRSIDTPDRSKQGYTIGGTFPGILLGGYMDGAQYNGNGEMTSEGDLNSTPGRYRDLMVFDRCLNENAIRAIDNSMFAVTFSESSLPAIDNNNEYICNDEEGHFLGPFFDNDSHYNPNKTAKDLINSPCLFRGSLLTIDTVKEMKYIQNKSIDSAMQAWDNEHSNQNQGN